jgi:hypothetical protein
VAAGIVPDSTPAVPRRSHDYLALLRRIHHALRPRTYVEIGVRLGHSLRLAPPGTTCIGIDPAADARPAVPGARIFTTTSDDFFAENDLGRLLDGRPVDLAFIDGMHLFEFALRDLTNLERWCAPTSIILVHDCLARDAVTAARRRTTDFWSGDVWKLAVCLRRYRPDLEFATAHVAPTGLGIIGGLDPTSTVLLDRYIEIRDRYIGLDFDAASDDREAALNVLPDDWGQVWSLISRHTRDDKAAER